MSEDVDKAQEEQEEEEQEKQEKLNPTVRIEEAGPCKKKLEVTVSAESVSTEIDKTYSELLEEMEVPGFRKGHVPRSVAQKRFGTRVSEEVKNGLIARALSEIIEEQEMDTIGEPSIDDVKFEEGAPLTYSATISLRPDVKFDEYKGVALERKSEETGARDIDERLENMRRQSATHAPVERAAKADDLLTMDFVLECEGKSLRDIKDAQLVLSGVSFFGLDVGPLEKLLGGRKNGDTAETGVTLPDSFKEEEYRGKEAALKITVKEIKEEHLPEINDEWAKSLDFDDMKELREEVGKSIKKHKKFEADADLARQVHEYLTEKADFDLPEDLVKSQIETGYKRKRLEMERQGIDATEVEKILQQVRGEDKTAEDSARKMLKGYFVLRHIADKEKIFTTEEEIEREIAMIGAQYGKSPQEMTALYEETGVIDEMRLEMRERKTIDFIIKNADSDNFAGERRKSKPVF